MLDKNEIIAIAIIITVAINAFDFIIHYSLFVLIANSIVESREDPLLVLYVANLDQPRIIVNVFYAQNCRLSKFLTKYCLNF